MTDTSLIDQILGDENATDTERELADRLHAAIAELERITNALTQLEKLYGSHP